MLQGMTGEDVTDWLAFAALEPWGCDIEDRRALYLAHAAATAYGGEGPNAEDYFTHWKNGEPEPPQTPEDVADIVSMMAGCIEATAEQRTLQERR